MHINIKTILSALFIFSNSLLSFGQADSPEASERKNIILVSSFNTRSSWTKEFVDGFSASLPETKFFINLMQLSILENKDLKPKPEDLEWILKKTQTQRIDAIVALDTPAISFIKNNYKEFPPSVKLVFAGQVGDMSGEVPSKENVLIIKKRLMVKDNILLGLKLFPDTKKIWYVTVTGKEGYGSHLEAQADIELLKSEGKVAGVNIEVLNGSDLSTTQMLDKIKNEKEPAFVLFFRWSSPHDKPAVSQDNALNLISDAAGGKVFGFTEMPDANILGGYMLNGVKFGIFSSGKMIEMLNGSIDSKTTNLSFTGDLKLNMEIFSKQELDSSKLPENVSFYKMPLGFWETIGVESLAAVFGIFATLVSLLFVAMYRSSRIAEKNSIMFKNLPSSVYVFLPNGDIIYSYSEGKSLNHKKTLKNISPEFFAEYLKNSDAILSGKRVTMEYYHNNQRRKAFATKLNSKVFPKNTLIASTVDISDLEKARRSAYENFLHLQITLNSIGDAVIATDENEIITFINPIASDLTGYPKEDAIGRNLSEVFNIVSYTTGEKVPSPIAQALSTRHIVQLANHTDLISRDGISRYHISDSAAPIIQNDVLTGAILVFRDVTDEYRKRDALVEAMHAAQEADKAKSYFLATMSHELRTPLNAVIGYSELTQDQSLSQDERVENLRSIKFAANTLLSLVNDILDLSKLEAGQTEIRKTPLSLTALANEFQSIFKFSTQKKGLYFIQEIPQDTPMIMMDSLRIKQALMNIIGNAIKFTKKGGVTVKVSYENEDNKLTNLRISLKDTGIGIEKAYLDKIFNPFEREYTTRVRGRAAYEGTGLGLPIAKRLIEKMGGTISVESTPNVGSTFHLHFSELEICPESEVVETGAEQNPMDVKNNSGEIRENLKVLIVDDILLNLKVLGKMLSTLNITVSEALNGNSALEKLSNHDDVPDLIMTDLWMPEMSGKELAQTIKENPKIAHIPIIAVTADTQIDDPDGLFDDILFKPISIKGIFELMQKSFPKENRA